MANYVAGNNETYSGLEIKCLVFLPEFHQIWISTTDFHLSL
jgi:hypothetical protein